MSLSFGRDRHIDLLCLTESWCDSDSAVLGRLRNAGDRPRPRHAGVDDLSVNHGGIVVVAAANISLLQIIDVDRPTTFEVHPSCSRSILRYCHRHLPSWFDCGIAEVLR